MQSEAPQCTQSPNFFLNTSFSAPAASLSRYPYPCLFLPVSLWLPLFAIFSFSLSLFFSPLLSFPLSFPLLSNLSLLSLSLAPFYSSHLLSVSFLPSISASLSASSVQSLSWSPISPSLLPPAVKLCPSQNVLSCIHLCVSVSLFSSCSLTTYNSFLV